MLIGMLAALLLLPMIAVAVLLKNMNSNKLHLILLGLIIGMVALIQPLSKLYAKFEEHPEAITGGGLMFGGTILFGCYIIFIVVLSGVLYLNVQTNRRSISKPVRVICQLPFIIGMIFLLFFFFGGYPLF